MIRLFGVSFCAISTENTFFNNTTLQNTDLQMSFQQGKQFYTNVGTQVKFKYINVVLSLVTSAMNALRLSQNTCRVIVEQETSETFHITYINMS